MLATSLQSLSGLTAFLAYFALALVLTLVFIRLYTWITPQDELTLLRANNSAAATAFSGALLGFAIPLASAITHSMSLLDCAIWGAIALVVQLLSFALVRLLLKDLPRRLEQGEMASGITMAGFALALGLINAACMSY